jgi:hypothetical protein
MKLPVNATCEEKLQLEIMVALKGSSSQQPVPLNVLSARLRGCPPEQLYSALDDLYLAHKVHRCLIVKYPKKGDPIEAVVYWSVGMLQIPKCYLNKDGEHVNRGIAA